MPLNIERIYDSLQNFDFSTLFTDELAWNAPATKKAIDIDDYHVRYAIARLMNVTVFEIGSSSGTIPDTQTREYLYKENFRFQVGCYLPVHCVSLLSLLSCAIQIHHL